MRVVEARTGRVFTRVSGLVLIVIFMLHAFACLFHFVAVVNGEKTTWIESSGIVDSQSTMDRYVCFLSFSAYVCFLLHCIQCLLQRPVTSWHFRFVVSSCMLPCL